jgi:hypothetical protein
MNYREYFENTKGVGILATADSEGNTDVAVYARPHVMDDGTFALIMRDRLSHHNLQSNPRAAYMFMQEGTGYRGRRFFLKKVREEQDSELLYQLRRRSYPDDDRIHSEAKFLVFFQVEKELPLIGPGKE